jgi:[ribosomal protein S18]-alanine N-acetyltransferase
MSANPEPWWRLHPLHPSHLPQVLAIERRAYAHPWSEGIFNDCCRAGYSSWVLTNTLGEVLAYALMSMAVGEAHILNLCVAPEHRRQGLARVLLDHLLRLARNANTTLVLLEVRKSNKAAQQLYEGYGFQRLHVRKAYYPGAGTREDAIVMGLDL